MNQEQVNQAAEAARRLGATGSRRMGSPRPGDDLTGRVQLPGSSFTVPASVATPEFIEEAMQNPTIPQDDVIKMLLAAPELIRQAQTLYDETDHLYRNKLAELSIKALSEPMFPGKKPEDGQRMASNEEERSLAVQSVCSSDVAFIRLAQNREAAGRSLHYERNQFEAAKLVAGLLQNGKN